MKKLFSIMMLCTILLGLAGCVDKEAQEEVKNYIDTTSVIFKEQEQKMLDSYSSVIGMNYTDDTTLCMELVTNTIPMADALLSTASAVTETITNEELKEVHGFYVSYATEFVDALRSLLKAVDEQDKSYTEVANAKLSNADGHAKSFRSGLDELKKKYKLEE